MHHTTHSIHQCYPTDERNTKSIFVGFVSESPGNKILLNEIRLSRPNHRRICLLFSGLGLSGTPLSTMSAESWRDQSPYRLEFDTRPDEGDVKAKIYKASCYCGRVRYEVLGEPERSKLCHCRACQLLHGAPFEWVSIFHKGNVRFQKKSLDHLYFYSGEKDVGSDAIRSSAMRPDLPLKVSCSHCRTPIADEGRHMWLAFTTLFGFTVEDGIPDSFKHGCHLFYGQRCVNLSDDEVKWEGHENKTKQWTSS